MISPSLTLVVGKLEIPSNSPKVTHTGAEPARVWATDSGGVLIALLRSCMPTSPRLEQLESNIVISSPQTQCTAS